MKPSTEDELVCYLLDTLEQADLSVERDTCRLMCRYLVAMLEVNERVNLTRISEPTEAVRLHLVDSLTALPELTGSPGGPAVDLGTGGGFPGVPLALASGRPFTLLDSVAKKAAAIEALVSSLGAPGPPIVTLPERSEELALADPGRYSVVVARAVAPLPSLVELASPLLAPAGLLIALKGCPEPSERESGSKVAALAGMEPRSWRELALPSGGEARTIVTYEKTGQGSIRLPRRPGQAQRRPLA